jgi:hypothetical protein
MFTNKKYIIPLFALSLVVFYIYISTDISPFFEKYILSDMSKNAVVLPKYSKKKNYIDIIDKDKKNLKGQIIFHETYDKLTLHDKLIEELNSLLVPVISKLNKKLGTTFNTHHIDYRKVEKKQDKEQNTLYVVIVTLFTRDAPQTELVFELFKGANDSVSINNIIDQKSVYKFTFEDTYNHHNIFMDPKTNLPIVPQKGSCSSGYPGQKDNNTVEHFGSRTGDFTGDTFKPTKNENIKKISTYYNLTTRLTYPAIEKNLFDRTRTSLDTTPGMSDTKLAHSKLSFKVNQLGIQDTAYHRNSWFVDEDKKKNITQVFPENKVQDDWDDTGTNITESGNGDGGSDYANEKREKVPRHHPAIFSYFGNNSFKNTIDSTNMFSLLNKGAENHTPM